MPYSLYIQSITRSIQLVYGSIADALPAACAIGSKAVLQLAARPHLIDAAKALQRCLTYSVHGTAAVQCRQSCLAQHAIETQLVASMQVTVCAVDPSSDQLTSIQLPADASLTDAAQLLGNALTEDDSSVQQYWVNLDPESQDDVIPRLPHGDPIFEINLVLLSARPGGKRCVIVLST